MCAVLTAPFTRMEPVTDVLHGIPVTDPYRWLEDQNSAETRAWIEEQTGYARAYFDGIPGRHCLRERVQQLLDVETFDSFLKCGERYYFRKRLPEHEQPSIYMREGVEGTDHLLVDPASRDTGAYTAVNPIQVSRDGSLLLYEVKHGGERASTFEILDVKARKVLLDRLPHGCLRGFAFAPDGKSFYYSHEATGDRKPFHRAVFHHVLGTDRGSDKEIFRAGQDDNVRLVLIAGPRTLGFLVYRFLEKMHTDFYILGMGSSGRAIQIVRDADYTFTPRLIPGRIFAIVDQNAPNFRIVEVQPRNAQNPLYFDLIPERATTIRSWAVTANHIVVSYVCGTRSCICVFDQFGNQVGELPSERDSIRITAASLDDDNLLLERESFTRPIEIVRYAVREGTASTWARHHSSLDPDGYDQIKINFASKDGATIPMFLVGRAKALSGGVHPILMTSYGGYGIPSTPRFSSFVSFFLERGVLFALPNIRGGSEFGASWHNAAKRRFRQTSFDDFLSAAEWLVETGRTIPSTLGIFGGSNSGLLVSVAMTQRPDLFRAVLCIAPILDMLRYHLFDGAYVWTDEFGSADNPQDFDALRSYSPYHAVRDGATYPATLIVSGDLDQNCNSLHARKMTARLQAANRSNHPIVLDYHPMRGHSPTLPLSERISALTDRIAFLCRELEVPL